MPGIIIDVPGKGSIEFGTMTIPNRKSKALYRTRGAMVEVLAYFRSDDCAEQFEKIIDFMIENIKPKSA